MDSTSEDSNGKYFFSLAQLLADLHLRITQCMASSAPRSSVARLRKAALDARQQRSAVRRPDWAVGRAVRAVRAGAVGAVEEAVSMVQEA